MADPADDPTRWETPTHAGGSTGSMRRGAPQAPPPNDEVTHLDLTAPPPPPPVAAPEATYWGPSAAGAAAGPTPAEATFWGPGAPGAPPTAPTRSPSAGPAPAEGTFWGPGAPGGRPGAGPAAAWRPPAIGAAAPTPTDATHWAPGAPAPAQGAPPGAPAEATSWGPGGAGPPRGAAPVPVPAEATFWGPGGTTPAGPAPRPPAPADATHWTQHGSPGPAPGAAPADADRTRWEATAAPGRAAAAATGDADRTRWEATAAPGRAPARESAETDRWPEVLPLPGADADLTRMSLAGPGPRPPRPTAPAQTVAPAQPAAAAAAPAEEPAPATPATPDGRRARRALFVVGALAAAGLATWGVVTLGERQATARDVALARAALMAARRAPGGGLDALLAAAAAHREAAAALDRLPPGPREALLREAGGARQQRVDVLQRLVPALLAAGRPGDAIVPAREWLQLAPSGAAHAGLFGALAGVPARRDEARRLALDAAAATADPEVRRASAEALLALHRPEEAAAALAGAQPPDLLLLRARARLLAGAAAEAAADARAAEGADVAGRAIVLARALLGSGGDAAAALAALDDVAPAARRAAWHAVRAAALEAAGRPGEAAAAFAEALAAAGPDERGEVLAERGRVHLRRGRRAEALADLARAPGAAARLDAAVARWCGGGEDAALADALEAVLAAGRAFEASPAVARAARRWQAWRALAGGDHARTLVERADRDPEGLWLAAESARRAEGPAAALALLEADAAAQEATAVDPDLAGLRAGLLLDVGRRDEARALLPRLPGPAAADLERRLLPRHAVADEVAAADGRALAARLGAGRCPLPAPSTSSTGAAALVAALHRLGWLVAPAGDHDDEARRRGARALARAAGLDPAHALAHAGAARLARDEAAAARAIERWPGVVTVRRQRFDRRFVQAARDAVMIEDATVLHAADPAHHDARGVLAVIRAGVGDTAGAWTLLEPVLEADSPHPPLLGLALQVATGRRDAVGEARTQARLAAQREAQASIALLRDEAWGEGDLAGLERRWRDLPRDGEYWSFRAMLALHVSDQREALLAFGRYLLVDRPSPRCFLAVAHSHGWNPLQRQEVVQEGLAEAVRAGPLDAAPLLARAAHLASGAHRAEVGDAAARASLAHAAADQAAAAAALAPCAPGPALLLAWCLIDAGDLVEARAALVVAEAAAGRIDLVSLLRARLAAAQGDAAGAAAALAEMTEDPRAHDSIYRFSSDPAFARVRAAPGLSLPPGWPGD